MRQLSNQAKLALWVAVLAMVNLLLFLLVRHSI
jgi:hypothetical protein